MSARKLADLLADQPDLTGAACRGLWSLFDEPAEDEDHAEAEARHHRAATLCRACPVLADCRDWAARISPNTGRPASWPVSSRTSPRADRGRPQ
ncbi:WhiB family transcriptional regulator [Gordonia iterans]